MMSDHFETGGLIVSKIVAGEGDRNQEFRFAVVLSDRTVNGTYGGMTCVNGVAHFTLRHGESISATGLPSGITYSVMEQEANQGGYSTASKGRDGTIPEQGTAQASSSDAKKAVSSNVEGTAFLLTFLMKSSLGQGLGRGKIPVL